MLWAVLSGFVASLIVPFTRYDKRSLMGWVYAILPLGLTFFFASKLPVLLDSGSIRSTHPWFPSLGISLSFHLDIWSLIFALLIAGIGALVTIYSSGYLHHDRDQKRFFTFLFMFMASMIGTVLSSNAIQLFVFWELTSLSSYFLIGFYHDDPKSRTNALQALLVTGTGGLAMLVGFIMIGTITGTYELDAWLLNRSAILAHPLFNAALGLILLGAFTKSAQFPFHYWLPNAMVAPTPVSAYLHSSTMVKAGVYLLGRLFPLFGASALWSSVLPVVGTVTILTGAFLALRATDMKLHLAHLTVSALGLLVLLIGLGSTAALHAAVFFVVAHAFYKGSLFMVAGSIHHGSGLREPEKLSGLFKKMPVTAVTALVAGASLASLPPLMGFFSKEMALGSVILPQGTWVLPLAITLAGMVYTAVFLWIAIKPFIGKKMELRIHEAPFSMWLGSAVLAALGAIIPLALPAFSSFWEEAASSISGTAIHLTHHAGDGFDPAILWSIASWIGGVVIFFNRRKIQTFLNRFKELWSLGPEAAYHQSIKSMLWLANTQTRLLQSGSLRYYFRIVIATTVILTGAGFLRSGFPQIRSIPFYFLETALAVMIIVGTLATLRTGEKLAAVAYLGVVGLAISLLFLFFGAPDLAMTQFAVEVLTLILLALVLYRLPHFKTASSKRTIAFDAILSSLAGFLMFLFVFSATYHEPGIFPPIADFYIQNTLKLAHGHNIVNVILVDFRGFDTLGEITVLGIAGIGAYSLLKLILDRKKRTP